MSDLTAINVPPSVRVHLQRGAAVVLNLSGGKDSQAMALAVLAYMEERQHSNKVYAVHADLGRAEWHQTPAVVAAQALSMGLDLTIVQHAKGDLLDRMVERAEKLQRDGDHKPFWPSPAARYCTSDMKRNPIDKFLRSLDHDLILSVEGLRAEESSARAKKGCAETRKQINTKRRDAITWRPIMLWTAHDVFTAIGGVDGENVHPAYALGNDRLSCSLCIMGSKGDLARGAIHNPEYANAVADLEEQYGWSFTQTTSIVDLCKQVGIRD